MIRGRKFFSKLVLCTVILLCISTSVYAKSAYANLTYDKSSVFSKSIGTSSFVNYSAINDKSSLFKVYANIHRAYPNKRWKKVKKDLMTVPGVARGGITAPQKAYWKIELNPKGPGTALCRAHGKIWY